MTETAHLELKVTNSGVSSAVKELDRLESAGDRTQKRLVNLGDVARGTFLGLSIVGGITAIVKATIEAEMATAQLEARLKSTGGAAGVTKTALLEMAASLQGVTIFDDEAIMGAESMLLTFTRVGKEVFPQALEAILNVSTAMGTDLQSAALQVGKALNDPAKGLGALARAGIQFTKGQKEVITNLVETGKTAEAQKIILGELENQMGGAARAARGTLGGSLVALKNSFMNVLEGDTGSDGIRGTVDAINALEATMNDQDVKAGFQSIVQGLFEMANFAAKAITSFVGLSKAIRDSIAADKEKSYQGMLAKRVALDDDIHALKGNPLQQMSMIAGGSSGEVNPLASPNEQIKKLEGIKAELDKTIAEKRASDARAAMEVTFITGDNAARMNPTVLPEGGGTGELLGDEESGPAAKAAKAAAKAAERMAEQRAEDYARLKDSLMTEEEAVLASYAAREAIISASAVRGSEEEQELRARSKAERDEELKDLQNRKDAELNALRDSLMTEEESIKESYARREAIVLANLAPGDEQAALIAKLQTQRDIELAELAMTQQAKHDQALAFMLTEEEMRISFQLREMEQLKLDEESKLISHEEFLAAKKRLEEIHAEELAQIARDKNSAALASYGEMFGSLGDMFTAFGGKQSKAAKAAFAIQKSLAIAQSIMNIQTALSNAMTVPYPGNIAAMATVVAEGASIVGNIQSIAYGGAHDKGGRIPAGKVGIVGEKGMEFVEGPANVTSRAQTKRMLDKASSGDGGVTAAAPVVHINTTITNTGSETRSAASDEKDARDLSRLIDNRVRETLQKEERQGGILWKRRNGG